MINIFFSIFLVIKVECLDVWHMIEFHLHCASISRCYKSISIFLRETEHRNLALTIQLRNLLYPHVVFPEI